MYSQYGISGRAICRTVHGYHLAPYNAWIAVRANRRYCFTNIKVQIVMLAWHREIVSRPPVKMCSMATAGPAKGIHIHGIHQFVNEEQHQTEVYLR
jgi:hypothetical protein